MSLFTLALHPDHLIYMDHSSHQLPLYVHSAPNLEVALQLALQAGSCQLTHETFSGY